MSLPNIVVQPGVFQVIRLRTDPEVDGPDILYGDGSPEGVFTAEPGSIFMSNSGSVYRKASGSGNTGWTDVGGTPDIQALLDGITNLQGSLLYRGASAWAGLPYGTAGSLLQTGGSGQNPSWVAPATAIQTLLDTIDTIKGALIYYNGTDWVGLDYGNAGQLLQTNGSGQNPSWVTPASGTTTTVIGMLGLTIDGGGSVPTTGSKGYLYVPYDCTLVDVTMLANASGSAVVDIKKSSYAGFPFTSSIAGSAKPTLTSAIKSQDTTMSGWTTTIAAGDVLEFNLDSVSTLTRLHLSLKTTR